VRRLRDTADRRKVHLEVTPQAVELGWSFFGPLISDVVAGMGAFTAPELAVVGRFLDTIIAAAVGQHGGPPWPPGPA
jgi:hypothetical protein